jgi:uncharacterized membrane-anchored protein
MTPDSTGSAATATRLMLNKVPEITVWFWVIKILCTTVGESFADWINMTLGVGLSATAILFTVVLAAVLTVQMRLSRYVPAVYWLTVVVVSITGTLYTDILTDSLGVPLAVSTSVFALLLAGVFGIWWARERTLSIHSIVTVPREAFYWLAVLVTFALGTAAGDWTLELTGWGPGASVVLPAGLIAIVVIGWRAGGNPVLAFWLAYILTRPLGANIGDYAASPRTEQGLGLGTALTSVVFLAAIAATVLYLTVSRADILPARRTAVRSDSGRGDGRGPVRERVVLGAYGAAALAAGLLLHHTSSQPHQSSLADEGGSAGSTVHLTPAEATAHFPAADVSGLSAVAHDAQAKVSAGDLSGAKDAATRLESTWDDAQPRLQPADGTAWTYLDGQIDDVLTSIRADHPDAVTEQSALSTLVTSLGG